MTDFVTGALDPAAADGPRPLTSVRDLKPIDLDLAGVQYRFRCPKLTAWAEFAVPAASAVTDQGRTAAMLGGMVMFLHTALSPQDSEALHRRKFDNEDPLDVPDLAAAFVTLVNTWGPDVRALANQAGMRLDLTLPEDVK